MRRAGSVWTGSGKAVMVVIGCNVPDMIFFCGSRSNACVRRLVLEDSSSKANGRKITAQLCRNMVVKFHVWRLQEITYAFPKQWGISVAKIRWPPCPHIQTLYATLGQSPTPPPQVLIWRCYSLHGAALKDMKRRLREWESQLSYEEETLSKLAKA